MPERVRDLHRRAAEAHTDPHRAIRHYLVAGMWEVAAGHIEGLMEEMLRRAMWETFRGWVHALPAAVREVHPVLLHGPGVCAFLEGSQLDRARALLERALEGYAATGDERHAGDALATLASCTLLQGDIGRCMALIARALTYPLRPETRVLALMSRATIGLFIGGSAHTQAALDVVQESGDPGALSALAYHLNPFFVVLPGGLERIERFCRLAAA